MPQRRKPPRRTPRARVISVVVESRRRAPDGPLFGAEAVAALEEIIRDAYAVAGIDATAPMRRDVAVLLRQPRRHRDVKEKKRAR